jgi:type IV pilus assembly protein PilV
MELHVYFDEKGFTLIEVLVAMLIMTVGLFGLLQVINVAIVHNMNNQFRHEAVKLADAQMALQRSRSFYDISTSSTVPSVTVAKIGINNAFKNYSVIRQGSVITPNTRQLDINVTWGYKNIRYNHRVSSLITLNVTN